MSYMVGIDSGGHWRYLTNGVDVYEWINTGCHYHFSFYDALKLIENPIRKWSANVDQLGAICASKKVKLTGAVAGGWFKEAIEEESIKRQFHLVKEMWEKYQKILDFERLKSEMIPTVVSDEMLYRWTTYHKMQKLSSISDYDGISFEKAIHDLFELRGYKCQLTKKSGDYGVDVIATKNGESIGIQVKHYSNPVGVKAVQEVSSGARFYRTNRAMVITNSTYTTNAVTLASRLNVTLIDWPELAKIWLQVYPVQDIPDFNEKQYEINQVKITDLLGKPMMRGEVDLLAKLKVVRSKNLNMAVWIRDVSKYTSRNPTKYHKLAVQLGYASSSDIKNAQSDSYSSDHISTWTNEYGLIGGYIYLG
jgi:HJR/Mrr/RecB family endonuclease